MSTVDPAPRNLPNELGEAILKCRITTRNASAEGLTTAERRAATAEDDAAMDHVWDLLDAIATVVRSSR